MRPQSGLKIQAALWPSGKSLPGRARLSHRTNDRPCDDFGDGIIAIDQIDRSQHISVGQIQTLDLFRSRHPEGRRVFPYMSVEENLNMGAYLRRDASNIGIDRDRIYADFPRLAERRLQAAGTLSGGEQQMLAIGRALMSRPRLIMFDEPSLGLAPNIVEQTFAIIRRIQAAGTTVLLVEQNAFAALGMCDHAYLLEGGRIVLSGAGADLIANEHVRKAYLGG
jgi:ABC-type branched-subunit amino acid transport system ATPase component